MHPYLYLFRVCVVEFFTDKEAEAFLRKGRRIKLDRHVLTVEPYKNDRGMFFAFDWNIHFKTYTDEMP